MRDLTRRTATGADAGEMEYPLCDVDRERLRMDRLRVERDKEEICVVDGTGTPLLRLILPQGVVDTEDERWLLDRARRIASIQRPDLRLVG